MVQLSHLYMTTGKATALVRVTVTKGPRAEKVLETTNTK